MSLTAFIKDLYSAECEFKVEADIVHQVEGVVTAVVKELIPNTLRILPGSKGRISIEEIANAGSYFEQTKIIAPDEYDFMLVIRELSEPGAIEISKGCREGYVKVGIIDQERWGVVSSEQTPDRSFQIAFLEFNMYVRQALELFNAGLAPFKSRDGELLFKNIVSRGKPYKQFSFVQTAYFEFRYPKSQADGAERQFDISGETADSGASTSDKSSETVKTTSEECELLYNRVQHSDSVQSQDFETLDLDVDLMACCRVPLNALSDYLPQTALDNPLLAKHGCHIVLKPCGNPNCIEEDKECRLISYTKSEQELMRNLHPNWKIVYKFMKFVVHFSEILGVDSYKLKSAVLHLSQKHDASEYLNVDQCMRLLLAFLINASSRNHMPSFFNEQLNVWNITSSYKYFVKWDIQLLRLLLDGIDRTPISEYDYARFRRILQVKIEQFCERHNVTALIELERTMTSSEFEKFCVQGNTFLEVVRGMEPELKTHRTFKYIALKMKLLVFVDVMKEIARCLFRKAMDAIRTLFLPRGVSD